MSKEQNERLHSSFTVSQLINDILEHLGIIIVAEAGHGKSYTAFTLVKEAMKHDNIAVIVFSPSTIWRRRFGSVNCVKVGTSAFNPIVSTKETEIEVIPWLRDSVHVSLDKKWQYVRNPWFEQLLSSKQHVLWEIKYRNGRRIKAFESLVLQYIYEMQEKELDKNPDYAHHYLVVFEELQNAFGTYSMNSDDSLELLTIFTQSRSDANIHYIGIGQRLNDISTKIVERLRPLIGMTLGERSLAKIKAMIPENLRARVQQLPQRHFIYLNGLDNPEIEIPIFHKEGHVTFLKPKIPQQSEPKKSILLKIPFINRLYKQHLKERAEMQKQTSAKPTTTTENHEKAEDDREDEWTEEETTSEDSENMWFEEGE